MLPSYMYSFGSRTSLLLSAAFFLLLLVVIVAVLLVVVLGDLLVPGHEGRRERVEHQRRRRQRLLHPEGKLGDYSDSRSICQSANSVNLDKSVKFGLYRNDPSQYAPFIRSVHTDAGGGRP